jgi:carboxyl-terminal processing protease
MRLLKTVGTLTVLLASAGSAQETEHWNGEIITDAFRGRMEFALDRTTPSPVLTLAVTVRDRTATGTGVITLLTADSIRFTSTVGGASTSYTGAFRGDSILGVLEARQGDELLGRGTWQVVRSAGSAAASPAGPRSLVDIFDQAWSLVDQRYGNFEAKGIDWNLMKAIYRPRALNAKSDRELADVLSRMLSHLNDNHISMTIGDSLVRPNGAPDRSSFVADSIVARRFIEPPGKANRDQWLYAWMADSIGYLRIDGFQDAVAARVEIDSILSHFRGAKGIVMDMRKHFGGDDRAANAVINRFATSRFRYLSSQTRTGSRSEFLAPREFFAEPAGSWQFTGPVMILTSRRTVSAGENFLLGMRELPQVTLVGDVTSGAFADVGHHTLANGWRLSFPFNRFLDKNGFSWEGVGLAPDIRFVAKPEEIAAGKDVVLDFAVEAVKAAASSGN